MKKFTAHSALSRRSAIEGSAAVTAGAAASAFLRIRSAYAVYPDRPVKIVVANTPGGPSDLVGRMVTAALQQSTDFHHREYRWGGRQYWDAKCCSRPMPIRSMPAFTTGYLMTPSRTLSASAS